MQVQVHADKLPRVTQPLARHVEQLAEQTLQRYGDRVTRVEVFFTDQDGSARSGEREMRCAVEVRMAGLAPIAVSNLADSPGQAADGAFDKLSTTLDRKLGKLADHKGRTSYAGEDLPAPAAAPLAAPSAPQPLEPPATQGEA